MTAAALQQRWSTVRAIIAWSVLIAFETVAQLALKAGGERLSYRPFGWGWFVAAAWEPWVLAGVAGYLGSFAAWMTILNRVPLSRGFPLTAIVMALVPFLSFVILGEQLTAWHAGGIALIVAGAALIGGQDT